MNPGLTHDIQVGVPLVLLYVLLTPLAALILPALLITCLVFRMSFRAAVSIFVDMLRSLRGAGVQIALSRYCFLIHIG